MRSITGGFERTQKATIETSALKNIFPAQLKKILLKHWTWVNSNEKLGEKADLSHTNLSWANFKGMNLKKANFQGANLQGVNFQAANLQEANFQNSTIQDANLQEANLRSAKLQGALCSENTNFQRVDLRYTNLQNINLNQVNFIGAQLNGAILHNATLRKANLQDANFKEAILTNVDMQGANLLRTIFRDAVLQDANLTDTKGLLVENLGGADVSGAKLPEAILRFDGLKSIEDASRNAGRYFIMILVACFYSLLSILTTKDTWLITNSTSSPLPIIGTTIPIVVFFDVAPILIFATYLYFHLHLQRIWEGLADLPAIFTDGKPLDRKAYPWFLMGLVSSHFIRLRENRPVLSRVQEIMSILMAWYSVPITLFIFWMKYLHRLEWLVTFLHIVVIVVSVWFGMSLYRLAVATLQGETKRALLWKKAALGIKPITSSIVVGLTVFCLAFFTIDGGKFENFKYDANEIQIPAPLFFQTNGLCGHNYDMPIPVISLKIPELRLSKFHGINLFGYNLFADIQDENISTKPPNWTGLVEDEIILVKGARLKQRNLRCAKAARAFLVRADLSGTNLQRIDLQRADLREANIQNANLNKANLLGTNLEKSDLRGANLLDIQNWKGIRSMKFANIYDVKNPPRGFLEWALNKMGAVSLPSDEEWEVIKVKNNSTTKNSPNKAKSAESHAKEKF